MFEFIQREDPANAIAGVYFALRRISYRSIGSNANPVLATETEPPTIDEAIGLRILKEIFEEENGPLDALTEPEANRYKERLLDLADKISEQEFDDSKERALEVLKEWETKGGYPKTLNGKSAAGPPIVSRERDFGSTEGVTVVSREVLWASPFRLMLILNLGLGVSLAYGLLCSAFLVYMGGKYEAQLFVTAYTDSFKTIISLGLGLGTALIVYLGQNVIPETIEKAFTQTQLAESGYFYYKRRFSSVRLSIISSAEFIIVGFIIFFYCQFPLSKRGEVLMLLAVCIEYAVGAYVVRKLIYVGMMFHSLLRVRVTRNLFRKREFDVINTYVGVVSTITVIFVCVHVIGYYGGPFLYGSILGQSIKPLVILPVLAAIFVLLTLNFYPRTVLQKLYGQSIDVEVRNLKRALRHEGLSAYERRSYLMEFDKISRDELRHSLARVTLYSLPTWISLLITVLGPVLRR
jgi:hypothetical protein